MIARDPDVETLGWYYEEQYELDDLSLIEEGEVGVAALRGEGEIQQGPDDEIGRAWEDLDALTDSA